MPYVKRQGTVDILDGAGASIAVITDVGDFSVSGASEGGADAIAVLNRSAYAGHVKGDDTEHSGSFSFRQVIETATSGGASRPWDVFMQTGSHAAETTDNPIATGPWTGRIKYTLTDGATIASWTYGNVRFGSIDLDESGDTVITTVNFTCYGEPTTA